MKIFYDGIIFACQKYGGVNRIYLELIRCLKAYPDVHMKLFEFPDSKLVKHGLFYLPMIGKYFKELDSLLLTSCVKKYCPDIYHSSYFRIPKGISCKKVITVYDMILEEYAGSFDKAALQMDQRKAAFETADKIIAISQSTKNDILRHYHIAESKVVVCYLAASSVFKALSLDEKSLAIARMKKITTKPYLLYVGQRQGYKNFLALLKAYALWERNKEVDLVCAGGRKNWSHEESEMIDKYKLGKSVFKIGGLNDEMLRMLYGCALAFVYPSLYEGFGIPILEAMACGTPVIVANTASMPEVAGDAGLYFDPGSIEALLLALNSIVDNSSLRMDLIVRGLSRSKMFSWEKMTMDTYDIYKDLLRI